MLARVSLRFAGDFVVVVVLLFVSRARFALVQGKRTRKVNKGKGQGKRIRKENKKRGNAERQRLV